MQKQAILSICIPTYNRVEVLKKCIDSIVMSNPFRKGCVEIVVSDNMSSDGTQATMDEYKDKFGYIVYNKNEENIGGDLNFIKVLSLAHGKFIKLHNDYCEFTETGLEYMVSRIEELQKNKPYIFLCSATYPHIKEIQYKSFDDFVKNEFLGLSWISAIGFWKEDFKNLPNKERMLSIKFMQTDWLLRIAKDKEKIVCWKGDLFHRIKFNQTHGDFNYINTFVNYPLLFDPYVKQGIISQKTKHRSDLALLENLSIWYYRIRIKRDKSYSYSSENVYSNLNSYFKCIPLWQIRMVIYIVKSAVIDALDYLHITDMLYMIMNKFRK